ncbi:hypothetical protein EHQ91_01055 [Leptospira biflexa]|uniref:hypothetical protein n=1 Tax=Leptospira biflexa TaxID=172 RepID=UPI0010911312|nr:hypothetical protein [Leptospira biflexa]TGM57473.1 hypothetical protein EHQ91_01055 [Leptospira biflexa]
MPLKIVSKPILAKLFVVLSLSIVFLTFLYKFNYLFAGEALSGWDTPGHVVLAKEFANIFENGKGIGWSDVWFGGFPVFYFYPPFYYFIVYLIHFIFSISIESAFSVSIFITILLLGFAIYHMGNHFIWKRFPLATRLLLGALSILFYFNYAGEGLQGTSIVGIIEGTVISSFTHALFLFGIISLDRYRKQRYKKNLILFVSISSLVFYSHLLSSIFYSSLLLIYLVIYRNFWIQHIRELLLSSCFVFFLISPVLFHFFKYSEYTSSVFYGYSYPPILSILSRDVYDHAMRASQAGENITLAFLIELFRSGRWLYLFTLVLLTFHMRSLQNFVRSRFLTTVLLVFFWMSLDYSFGYIIPNIKIHNYRAFDCFFLTFSILMPMVIVYSIRIQKKYLPLFPILVFLLFSQYYLFIKFDPIKYQEYKSPLWKEARTQDELVLYDRLLHRLKELPKGTIIQPEIIKTKSIFGGPHFWIPLFYEAGIRNNLGLTVESSYYSTLVFNWQSFGFGHTFRWGTDIDWRDHLVALKKEPDSGYFLDFLLRSGVQYMMGFSPEFADYILLHRNRLVTVAEEGPFQIIKIQPKQKVKTIKPIGLIHADSLNQNQEFLYQKFLKTSNFLQMYLSHLGYQTKVLRISRNNLEDLDQILPSLSSVILITNQNGLGEVSWIKGLDQKGIPTFLFAESSLTNAIPLTEENLRIFLNQIPVIQNPNESIQPTQSFFSPKQAENGILLLDDSAREYLIPFSKENQKQLVVTSLPELSGKIYLGMMFVSFFLFLSGFVLTNIEYFSFSNAKK